MIFRFKDFAADANNIETMELAKEGRRWSLQINIKGGGYTDIKCRRAEGEEALKAFAATGPQQQPDPADMVRRAVDASEVAAMLEYGTAKGHRRLVVIMRSGMAFEIYCTHEEAKRLMEKQEAFHAVAFVR